MLLICARSQSANYFGVNTNLIHHPTIQVCLVLVCPPFASPNRCMTLTNLSLNTDAIRARVNPRYFTLSETFIVHFLPVDIDRLCGKSAFMSKWFPPYLTFSTCSQNSVRDVGLSFLIILLYFLSPSAPYIAVGLPLLHSYLCMYIHINAFIHRKNTK